MKEFRSRFMNIFFVVIASLKSEAILKFDREDCFGRLRPPRNDEKFPIEGALDFHLSGNDSIFVKTNKRGQSAIEFTFAMTVTLLMVFALLMVFRWAGVDLADRRIAHERLINNGSLRPEEQLQPDFYKPRKIDSAFRGFDLRR